MSTIIKDPKIASLTTEEDSHMTIIWKKMPDTQQHTYTHPQQLNPQTQGMVTNASKICVTAIIPMTLLNLEQRELGANALVTTQLVKVSH